MKSLYFLGLQLNGLEFVTYILIPISILLTILVYVYFNIKIIKMSFDFDLDFLDEFDKNYNKKLKKLKVRLEKEELVDEKIEEKEIKKRRAGIMSSKNKE